MGWWVYEKDIFDDCAEVVALAKKYNLTSLQIFDIRDKLNTRDNNAVESYLQRLKDSGHPIRHYWDIVNEQTYSHRSENGETL